MRSKRRAEPTPSEAGPGIRVLKKYPNRRLYDTQSSAYITLADVKAMVLAQQAFEVRDAKSGEDLTRSILLQIILEEESGGLPIFSTQMLEQIIRFYGHTMQGLMGTMLERNLKALVEMQALPGMQGWMGGYGEPPGAAAFAQMQEQMQEQMKKNAEALFTAWGSLPGASR
jgi:polyhydroxyalkanoate synthesis repressor PhaR